MEKTTIIIRRDMTKDEIKQIMKESLKMPMEISEIRDNVRLLDNDEEDNLGLDSLDIIELVTALENRLNISIPDDDIRTEYFSSVAKLTDYVNGKL